jgi:leader peptidase (prepilin peptidase)/N-methyltransferase
MESEPTTWLLRSPYGLALAMLFGAVWGSFANVCIHRIPRGQSLLRPPSHCPRCAAPIAWYDNVPLLGYLLLLGRCRRCQARVSPRYVVIEGLAILIAALVYARFVGYGRWAGPPAVVLSQFVVYFFFSLTLLILSAIDVEHQLLPDRITYPAIPAFLLLGQLLNFQGSGVSIWQAGAGAGFGHLIVRLISDGYYYLTGREGLGYGDGKLLAMVGALLGFRALPYTLLVGSLVGLFVGVPLTLLLRVRCGASPENPENPESAENKKQTPLFQIKLVFGPFLAFGAFLYLLLLVGRDVDGLLLKLLAPLFGEAV